MSPFFRGITLPGTVPDIYEATADVPSKLTLSLTLISFSGFPSPLYADPFQVNTPPEGAVNGEIETVVTTE